MTNTDKRRNNLRNIAIIAHVDHGKTTLLDAMLRQTGAFADKTGEVTDCIMDSNDLERERGITILSKNTSVKYGDTTIHIVDTPGHADFGSEVERILRMVDGVILMVDAMEGPMPQTRFVLKKSLDLKMNPIVVINKIDKPNCDPHAALDKVFTLFMELGANDAQLDFPVLYAVGKDGWASEDLEVKTDNLDTLFKVIIDHVPAPLDKDDEPLRMLVTMLDYSSYTGRIGIGRIFQGKVLGGETISMGSSLDKTPVKRKIVDLMGFYGLNRVPLKSAHSGDIIAMSGLEGIEVGDTVSSLDAPGVLPTLEIEQPTISMEFFPNDSIFSGREGKFVTVTQIRDRLFREQHTNVGLKVEELSTGGFKVSGRGELHLSILIETMRREGFELAVSRMVVIKHMENGVMVEPMEFLVLDAPTEFQGAVIEALGRRGAKMKNMEAGNIGRVKLEYTIASRSLIGFKSEFLTLTKGNGLMYHNFHGYMPEDNVQPPKRNGVFIVKETGKTASYAINALQDQGKFFVGGSEAVYAGQIVGENCRDNDLVVNPCKEKKQTNMRQSAADAAIILVPPIRMSLEQSIEYVGEDEFVEITPKSLRLRKKILDHTVRKRSEK